MTNETKFKSNSVVSAVVDAGVLSITVKGVGIIHFDPTKASEEVRAAAMMHGFKQRLGDAAAMTRDPATGQPATAQDKHDAIRALADHYLSGTADWNVKREAREGGFGSSVTLQAIADVQKVTVADMKARLEALAEKKGKTYASLLKEVGTAPAVVKRIGEIRLAAAKPSTLADGLLDELGE